MIYLRFDSEQTAIDAMPQYRASDQWITASHEHALDPIGAIDGHDWHMNFQGELPEALLPFVVIPLNPRVLWA